MKNKGFTIMELLASFLIIAAISSIAIISYNAHQRKIENNYYKSLEDSLLLSGSDFFNQNRSEMPINSYSSVTVNELMDNGYMEEIVDVKGEKCRNDDSIVYIYQDNLNYNYEVCLKCGNYESSGTYCQNNFPGVINIHAKDLGNNSVNYNPLLSYKMASIAKGDVLVTFSLDKDVSYYLIRNVDTDDEKRCNAVNNQCERIIDKTGTYLISAYDSNNQKVANDRSVVFKIDKENPRFTLNYENKYVILDGTDKKNVLITITDLYDDFAIKNIKYQIKRENDIIIDNQELNDRNVISHNLDSGSYELEVIAHDMVNKEKKEIIHFDVSYVIKLEYKKNEVEDFEVIKGKKYGYLNSLPTTYKDKDNIEWLYENTIYNDETMVTLGQEHTLFLKKDEAIITCNNKNYNGSEQVIASCFGGMISNHKQTNAGNYLVKCLGDDNHRDSTNTCTINKINATCPTLGNYSGTHDGNNHSITVNGGSGGDVEYRTSTTGEWTSIKPQRKDIGTTIVYVRVNGDINHNTIDCGNRSIEIKNNCYWSDWNLIAQGWENSNQSHYTANTKKTCNETSPSFCGSGASSCWKCYIYQRYYICN